MAKIDPLFMTNTAKTTTFGATHNYKAHISEYPSGAFDVKIIQKCSISKKEPIQEI